MYRFDKFGNLTTQNMLSNKEELISQIEFIYDEKHFPIRNFIYDNEKNLVEKNEFKINKNGYIQEQKKYDAGEKLLERVIFERQNEKLLQYKFYDNRNKLLMQFVNQYEGQDIEKTLRFDRKEKLLGSHKYKYDLERNLVEEIVLDAQKNVKQQQEFLYKNPDEQGNWTQKQILKNGTYVDLIERKLIYYK